MFLTVQAPPCVSLEFFREPPTTLALVATAGVCGIEFDRKDIAMNKLVLATLESRYRLYDMRTHHPVHGYSFLSQAAHQSTVWSARHLPQNRDIFMTCGGNGSLELWKYSYPTQRAIKEKDGHDKGVLGQVRAAEARTGPAHVLSPVPCVPRAQPSLVGNKGLPPSSGAAPSEEDILNAAGRLVRLERRQGGACRHGLPRPDRAYHRVYKASPAVISL